MATMEEANEFFESGAARENMRSTYREAVPAEVNDVAFGLFDYTMVPKLRRILKKVGIRLIVRQCRKEWGDQVEVRVERMNDVPKP